MEGTLVEPLGHILVVDDEETVRRSIQKRLEKEGYRVVAIDNALDALKIFEMGSFDTVLSDIRMPEMDGIELLVKIQNVGRHVPVIIITGDPSLETAQESVKRGAYDYITKPIQKDGLTQTVSRAVQKKRLQDSVENYQLELEKRVQEQTRIIRALFQMANQLNALETMEDVLSSLSRGVHRHVRSERVIILLRHGKAEELYYAHSAGLEEHRLKDQGILIQDPIVQQIFQAEGAICIEDDKRADSRGRVLSQLGDPPWLAVGLRHRREPFGVILAAERLADGGYTRDDLRVLTYIGDSASVAIHNQMVSESLRLSYLNIIRALAFAIEAKDPYTRGHSERVGNYAANLAKRMGLPEEQALVIGNAAILHDIGKVEIARSIIQKPARLTEIEYADMKSHPAIGEIMIEGIAFLKEAKPLIRHHHERWDGRGYPDGLQGEEIPLGSRIIAIADTYDALTTQRPYRNDTSKERAILKLREEKGKHLDPELVEGFIEMVQQMG
jgi:response regulator RpfG family c-di-GMP phosphodiesterase